MLSDIIIIGGSFAGLAAATQIARARRNVLVVDSGLRRNRYASAAHGFLGQDGRAPGDIIADARVQLLKYPTVKIVEGTAIRGEGAIGAFTVTMADGESHQSKRVVLASGIVDELEDIKGLAERWGSSVHHCPYCDGYEIAQGRIGVISVGPMSVHMAELVSEWGHVTLLVNGTFVPDEEQIRSLQARGIAIETSPITEITGFANVHLADGRALVLDGIFASPRSRMASPLAQQLGCNFLEGPMGPYVETTGFMQTSIAGVFAAGDMARPAGSVSIAVGDGCMAGVGAHQSLVFQ